MTGFWKDDHLILTVAPAPFVSAFFGISFDEYLCCFADVFAILLL
jgi:hypothetical protein